VNTGGVRASDPFDRVSRPLFPSRISKPVLHNLWPGISPLAGRPDLAAGGRDARRQWERSTRRWAPRAVVQEASAFLATASGAELAASGKLAPLRRVRPAEPPAQDDAGRFRQSVLATIEAPLPVEVAVPAFHSLAEEWTLAMLHAAAGRVLEVILAADAEGYELVKAGPGQILFDGPNPVFVDPLALRKRLSAHGHLALPDFLERFLQPLNAAAGRPGGLLFPRGFGPAPAPDAASAGGRAELSRLAHLLEWLRPSVSRAVEPGGLHPDGIAARTEFLELAFSIYRPKLILELGCRPALTAGVAAYEGQQTVAIDRSACAVGDLWQHSLQNRLPLLPLVVDLADPTPGRGWCNAAVPSFLERARGQFDAMVALDGRQTGGLLDRTGVDLTAFFELAADLTRDLLIMELPQSGDGPHSSEPPFEAALSLFFDVAVRRPVPGCGTLYLLRKHAGI
jgi:hypothetical protein